MKPDTSTRSRIVAQALSQGRKQAGIALSMGIFGLVSVSNAQIQINNEARVGPTVSGYVAQGAVLAPVEELRTLLGGARVTMGSNSWLTEPSGKATMVQGTVNTRGGSAGPPSQTGVWMVTGSGLFCLEANAVAGARKQTQCQFVYRLRDGNLVAAISTVPTAPASPISITKLEEAKAQ
jgi:hypothetical protein